MYKIDKICILYPISYEFQINPAFSKFNADNCLADRRDGGEEPDVPRRPDPGDTGQVIAQPDRRRRRRLAGTSTRNLNNNKRDSLPDGVLAHTHAHTIMTDTHTDIYIYILQCIISRQRSERHTKSIMTRRAREQEKQQQQQQQSIKTPSVLASYSLDWETSVSFSRERKGEEEKYAEREEGIKKKIS